ncbi:MAG: ATP-binding protein, partial [Acidimicrobiia bacterium]
MTPPDEQDTGSTIEQARQDVRDLRRSLQEGVAVETTATSIDGQTFDYQSSLDEPVPLGGYVVIEPPNGRRYLGQVTDRQTATEGRGRVTVDVPQVAIGGARVSQAEIQLEARMVVGDGRLLARLSDGELVPTTLDDVFERAALALAGAHEVATYLDSTRRGAAALDIGWSTFAGPDVRATMMSGGFNRHTFLCGQSGSGKTFSLGVVLERLLMETSLRMIILDPNSDFVRINETRQQDSYERTVANPVDDYADLAERYSQATETVRVLRPGADERPLQIRFSELTAHEQATVLKLDPLRDRTEFRAFRRIAERMADHSYSLQDVRAAALATLQEDARQIGLRVENLGLADWDVWAEDDQAALGDQLADDWRGLVLDVGGLSSADEKNVVAMSLLGRLWRSREERQPVLVVIDEAHNICPSEPTSELQELATDHVVRIAAEGRKFGIYLLLSTQRPQKLHPNVLSQCDNLILMRMNSHEDVDHLESVFSFVPPRLL